MIDEPEDTPEQASNESAPPRSENKTSATDDGPSPQVIAAVLSSGSFAMNEKHVHGSILEQSVKFAEEYMRPEIAVGTDPVTGNDIPIVITKDGVRVMKPAEFDEWNDKPRFRKGMASLFDLTSFIGHVNRYKDKDTIVFADNNRDHPSLTAVLDYHKAGSEAEPRFGHHRSLFNFPLSDQWKKWTGMDGKKMKMADFAEFIETYVGDIMPAHLASESDEDEQVNTFVEAQGGTDRIADPATMMQLSVGLTINENAAVINATRLQTGEGELSLKVESEAYNRAGEKITVPTMFALGIPVVANGPEYRLFARLRYRRQGESVVFWYDLWRTDKVFDRAFDGAIDSVQQETGVTVWLGKPE